MQLYHTIIQSLLLKFVYSRALYTTALKTLDVPMVHDDVILNKVTNGDSILVDAIESRGDNLNKHLVMNHFIEESTKSVDGQEESTLNSARRKAVLLPRAPLRGFRLPKFGKFPKFPKFPKFGFGKKKSPVGSPAAKSKPQAGIDPTPKSKNPKSQDPKLKDPKSQDPKLKDPKSQDPNLKDPKSQDPNLKDPKAQNSNPKDDQNLDIDIPDLADIPFQGLIDDPSNKSPPPVEADSVDDNGRNNGQDNGDGNGDGNNKDGADGDGKNQPRKGKSGKAKAPASEKDAAEDENVSD